MAKKVVETTEPVVEKDRDPVIINNTEPRGSGVGAALFIVLLIIVLLVVFWWRPWGSSNNNSGSSGNTPNVNVSAPSSSSSKGY